MTAGPILKLEAGNALLVSLVRKRAIYLALEFGPTLDRAAGIRFGVVTFLVATVSVFRTLVTSSANDVIPHIYLPPLQWSGFESVRDSDGRAAQLAIDSDSLPERPSIVSIGPHRTPYDEATRKPRRLDQDSPSPSVDRRGARSTCHYVHDA
jgi:hypothetical protein